jgi:cytochrome P450
MDPPRHAQYRALTSRHSRRALSAPSRASPSCREIVARAIERFGDGGGSTSSTRSPRPPLAVIMELLGVPRADWAELLGSPT